MNNAVIEPMLLNSRQAAKALGVCERTLYSLTKSGQLHPVHIGRAVRYDRQDLREFIDRQKNI
jgi:excisionase family DNA binding protein